MYNKNINIYTTNLQKFMEDIESFVIVKNKIENDLIEKGKLEKRMSVNGFLNYLNFNKDSIGFIDNSDKKNQKIIFFKIFKIKNNIIIPYSSDNDNLYFLEDIKSINYDISKLKQKSQLELLTETIDKYYLINSNVYTL